MFYKSKYLKYFPELKYKKTNKKYACYLYLEQYTLFSPFIRS